MVVRVRFLASSMSCCWIRLMAWVVLVGFSLSWSALSRARVVSSRVPVSRSCWWGCVACHKTRFLYPAVVSVQPTALTQGRRWFLRVMTRSHSWFSRASSASVW